MTDYLDTYRQIEEPYEGVDDLLLQLNHPRGIQFDIDGDPSWDVHAMFYRFDYRRELPLDAQPTNALTAVAPSGTTLLDFDAIEVLNRFSWPIYLEVRADWFALLNQGVVQTATGNSDSHATQVELAGFPLNLVRCETIASAACLVDGVRAGQVTVTTGPVVSLVVDGVGPGGTVVSDSPVAHIRVQAAEWVVVPQVRLIVNGEPVFVSPIEPGESRDDVGVLDATYSIPIASSEDSWVVAEAGWPVDEARPTDHQAAFGQTWDRVAPGYLPIGFTNPVRIDVTGDGWQAPGLPD